MNMSSLPVKVGGQQHVLLKHEPPFKQPDGNWTFRIEDIGAIKFFCTGINWTPTV